MKFYSEKLDKMYNTAAEVVKAEEAYDKKLAEEKVKELINLGDLSSVEKYVNPPEGVTHTFDHPYPDVTIAYCRDRGEDYSIHRWTNLNDYLRNGFMFHGVDYLYWYDNNKWSYLEAD